MNDLRIAVVVCPAPVGEIETNLARAARWAQEAGAQGAGLICFPEMNITGYTTRPEILHWGQPIPGPVTQRLVEIAVAEKMVILAGMAETGDHGHLFASHLVVTPDGLAGTYRKLHVAPPEHPLFTAGNHIPLFTAGGIRFGIQLCYDAHFPELTTNMAVRGADLVFLPHASPRNGPQEKFDSWMRHLPARAYDNGLFVVACNQTGRNGKGLEFPGIAMVIDPSGKVMARDVSGTEGILVVDLDAEKVSRVRNHPMRYFLPNRRPEIYGRMA